MKRLPPLLLLLTMLTATLSSCQSASTPTSSPEPATSVPPAVIPETQAPPTATSTPAPTTTTEPVSSPVAFTLISTAFEPDQPIPARYTCAGQDISPQLAWNEPPDGTKGFALIMDDPDANGWVHWVLYNLPADARSLAESIPSDANLPDGSRHGLNSWNKIQYGGPCPPSGTHHYVFKLYALDAALDLPAGATTQQLQQVMQGHILAQAELIGTYAK